MSILIRKELWAIHGDSVKGVSHEKSGLPNQDAWSSKYEGNSLVLAVADGHGNSKSFRSDRGAKIAVKVATETLIEFAKAFATPYNLGDVEHSMTSALAKEIVNRWQNLVNDDLRANAFDEKEFAILSSENRQLVEKSPLVAYGATVIGVIITESFIGYIQLGDGDVLVISENGEVSRPLPRDERLIANETTSLCGSGISCSKHRPSVVPTGAWADFRVGISQAITHLPVLIIVSTDGYSNSFRTEADFLKVGSDYLEIIRKEGVNYLKENLHDWLVDASKAGSGDDITLGIIYRMENSVTNDNVDKQLEIASKPTQTFISRIFSCKSRKSNQAFRSQLDTGDDNNG